MKKASAKIRRKIKVKLYRELNSMDEKFEFKRPSSFQDSRNKLKRS